MIATLTGLHGYLVFNGAIAAAYVIARLTLNLPFFKNRLSQVHRLQFARSCFGITLLAFMVMPFLISLIPSELQSDFQFAPILKSASASILEINNSIHKQVIKPSSTSSTLSIFYFVLGLFSAGIALYFIKYFRQILALRRLYQESYCRHKINNIHILFNNQSDLPFCWGFLNKHFISIPNSMLQNHHDIKISIRHELQHIRQGDTHWLQLLSIIKLLCFWNVFVKLWINWLDDLQELSCDESIILRNQSRSAADYAQCLINVAQHSLSNPAIPGGVLGIHKQSSSFLYRRVNMLFGYKQGQTNRLAIIAAYMILFFTSLSVAFALNGSNTTPLSAKQVSAMIKKAQLDKTFFVETTPEVVNEINHIRSNDQSRSFMRASLQRMKNYQPTIEKALSAEAMPADLLVIPLVESGYQPLDQSKNPVLAAGIWQIIPETAKRLGLEINKNRDDRLNTILSTKAALAYLKANHEQFKNWKLAAVAYEIGEKQTEQLIQLTGSQDTWELAQSPAAPKDLKRFLAMLDAALIIMHNPSLVS